MRKINVLNTANGSINELKRYIEEQFIRKTQECDRYHKALKDIKEVISEINLTLIGGEKSPKDEWVSLYTITCARILQIISKTKEDR